MKLARKNKKPEMAPSKDTEGALMIIRDVQVMLDCDVAVMYGVKREDIVKAYTDYPHRFPFPLAFQLTKEETQQVEEQSEHLKKHDICKFKEPPIAFSEQGLMMMSFMVRSEEAVASSFQVLNSYLSLREFFMANRNLAQRLESIENRLNAQFTTMYTTLDQMQKNDRDNEGPRKQKRKIGFKIGKSKRGRPKIGFKF